MDLSISEIIGIGLLVFTLFLWIATWNSISWKQVMINLGTRLLRVFKRASKNLFLLLYGIFYCFILSQIFWAVIHIQDLFPNKNSEQLAQVEYKNEPRGFSDTKILTIANDEQIVTIRGRLISYKDNTYYEFQDLENNIFAVKLEQNSGFDWTQIAKGQLIDLIAKISNKSTAKQNLIGISAVIIKHDEFKR